MRRDHKNDRERHRYNKMEGNTATTMAKQSREVCKKRRHTDKYDTKRRNNNKDGRESATNKRNRHRRRLRNNNRRMPTEPATLDKRIPQGG